MKKSKKVLLTMLSAAALVATTVFGTVAYFTDRDADVNTFTVGQVRLELDEADVTVDGLLEKDSNGNLLKRVKENKYHLIPGQTYIKDPTVHVKANSADCYVFVAVDNQIAEIEWNDDTSYNSIVTQMSMNGWELLTELDGREIKPVQMNGKNVFVYGGENAENNIVPESETITDLKVFGEFRIDGDNVIARKDAEGAAPDGMFYIDDYNTEDNQTAVTVTAYAIQAEGFDSALVAWNSASAKFTNE